MALAMSMLTVGGRLPIDIDQYIDLHCDLLMNGLMNGEDRS